MNEQCVICLRCSVCLWTLSRTRLCVVQSRSSGSSRFFKCDAGLLASSSQEAQGGLDKVAGGAHRLLHVHTDLEKLPARAGRELSIDSLSKRHNSQGWAGQSQEPGTTSRCVMGVTGSKLCHHLQPARCASAGSWNWQQTRTPAWCGHPGWLVNHTPVPTPFLLMFEMQNLSVPRCC